MITPLILFENKLPKELLNYIQNYLTNDIAINALKEYFSYLYHKKELYEDFVYDQYYQIVNVVDIIIVELSVGKHANVIVVLYLILHLHICLKIFVCVSWIIRNIKKYNMVKRLNMTMNT